MPFLLLLVGGQDRITSFAVEDNELWIRHLIWLLLQILTTCFVFYQSLHLNNLWIPTIFLLLAGTIKYAERIAALYLASSDGLGFSVLRRPLTLGLKSETAGEKSSDTVGRFDYYHLVQRAHEFAYMYKGLIVDHMFSSHEHIGSREFFSKRSAGDALKLLEIRLNYFYDLLHTKVLVATSSMGIATRFVSTGLVVAAFALFLIIEEKRTFEQTFDVFVTYALFFGVLGLDMVTLLLWFYSDWAVAYPENFDKDSLRFKIINKLLSPKEQPQSKIPSPEKPWRIKKVISRRWSENLLQFNFLNYCYQQRSRSRTRIKTISDIISNSNRDKLKYVSSRHFDPYLWEFIFDELLEKSYFADDAEEAKRISSARGEWILENGDFDYSISSKVCLESKVLLMMKAFYCGTLLLNSATTLIHPAIMSLRFVMLLASQRASWLLNSGIKLIHTFVTVLMLVNSASASQITCFIYYISDKGNF
nr:hypothetical protein CFP56_42310 [Quercus suber]